ncbi:unnamed protein product [Gordionus sp. m RMFG-2023]
METIDEIDSISRILFCICIDGRNGEIESTLFQFQIYHSLYALRHARTGVLDDLLYDYFEDLIQNGRLKNFFLFLFGDHGLRYGSPKQTLDGMLEDRMLSLLAIPPDNFFTDVDQNDTIFRINTQRLVTAFDFHKTLLNLFDEITKGKNKYSLTVSDRERDTTKGISFLEPIPKNRTCESAFISTEYCPCNWIKTAPPQVSNKTISGNANDIDALYISKLIRYGVDLAIKNIKNILLVDELELAIIIQAILVTNNNVTSEQDLKMLAVLNINTSVNVAVKISDIDETQLPKVFELLKRFVLAFKF